MTAPRKGVQWGRDADGRLVGLSKVDTWTKARAGRKGSHSPLTNWRQPFNPDKADAALAKVGKVRR